MEVKVSWQIVCLVYMKTYNNHACKPTTQEVNQKVKVMVTYTASYKSAWAKWNSASNINNMYMCVCVITWNWLW